MQGSGEKAVNAGTDRGFRRILSALWVSDSLRKSVQSVPWLTAGEVIDTPPKLAPDRPHCWQQNDDRGFGERKLQIMVNKPLNR